MPFASEFAVQGYLESLAQRFVQRLRCQLLSVHLALPWIASISPSTATRSGCSGARNIEQALVIGVSSDLLFPLSQQQAIADFLVRAGVATRFAPLPCIEGHDSFLVDLATFGREIGAFLRQR